MRKQRFFFCSFVRQYRRLLEQFFSCDICGGNYKRSLIKLREFKVCMWSCGFLNLIVAMTCPDSGDTLSFLERYKHIREDAIGKLI